MKKRLTLLTLFAVSIPTVAFAAEEGSSSIMNSPIIPALGEFIPMVLGASVMIFALNKFAWPMIIKTLDERGAKIEGSLKSAEEAKIEAEEILVEYKVRLAEAHRDAAQIVDAGRKAGEVAREDIVAKANEEAAAVVARAQAATEAEKRAASAELEAKVAEFAVAIAGKLIGDKLTAEGDAQLIDQYLSQMGSFNDN